MAQVDQAEGYLYASLTAKWLKEYISKELTSFAFCIWQYITRECVQYIWSIPEFLSKHLQEPDEYKGRDEILYSTYLVQATTKKTEKYFIDYALPFKPVNNENLGTACPHFGLLVFSFR